MIFLRDYQVKAIESVFLFYKLNEGKGAPLIVAPTGSGKSFIIAGIVKKFLEKKPDAKILVLAHRQELILQNANKLMGLSPELALCIGIYAASIGEKRLDRITFAMIQSIYNKSEEIFSKLGEINLVIVDECHLIPEEGEGMYLTLLGELKKKREKMGLVGLTATPFRLDAGVIYGQGEKSIFSDVCFDIGLRPLIDAGVLCRLTSKGGMAQADLSNVRIRGGDYVLKDAEAAINQDPLTIAAVNEIVKWGALRKKWLIFCAGVHHAERVCEEIKSRGVDCDVITGETPNRGLILEDFRRGTIRAITNCDVLTTGFDDPGIDMIVLLRGTKSAGLFMQMVGRGLRMHEGKSNCLVLDFCGNLERFGPIDCIKIKKVKGKAKIDKIPCKKCPQCGDYLPIKTTDCECGYKFEMLSSVHEAEASEAPILSEVAEFRVIDTLYKRHKKEGGRDSLRVDYICQREDKHHQERISEFVCLEHDGWAKFKALEWWANHCKMPLGFEPDIQIALENSNHLKIPKSIVAKKDGKWWRLQSITFKTEEELSRNDIINQELGVNLF